MKRIEEMTEKERQERIAIYNRPDSDHRKVDPVTYPPDVNWGHVYNAILRGKEKAKAKGSAA